MRTAHLNQENDHNQAIRLPIDFQFEGVNELEITKSGGVII